MEIKEENSGGMIIKPVKKEEDSRITIQERRNVVDIDRCFKMTIHTRETVKVTHVVVLLEIFINC